MTEFPFEPVTTTCCGLDLVVPDPKQVEQAYRDAGGQMPFPYWSKLWPSAMAMAEWLRDQPELISGKSVLELGAGLGLPSFIAASYANHVTISDYIPDALTWIGRNIQQLGLKNADYSLVNWHHNLMPNAEVVLMSDVGYDPSDFGRLQQLISKQLQTGGSVLLAVPERSVSAVFIGMLEDFHFEKKSVVAEGVQIILFALKKLGS
jgi:predicted nicotinamide N-methyase